MSTAMMAKKMNEKSDGYCYVEAYGDGDFMNYLCLLYTSGIANMVLPYLGVLMGYTGDLIQFITFGVLRGTRTGWPIAIAFAAFYRCV